tara:strand:+ start:532 stop:828 length:297 start_codon:yes stop_codon:yes gene_type:complete
MADLHHLPDPPLPDGWEPSSMFAGAFVRYVSLVPGWTPDAIRAQPFAENMIHLLVVEEGEHGWTANVAPGVVLPMAFRARNEAIAEVEAAYCNCRVRR